jgi:hypothetical protein
MYNFRMMSEMVLCGRDQVIVGITTTYAISAYHTTKVVSSNPAHGEVYSIQHYVIKFVSDLRQDSDDLSSFHVVDPICV